MRVKAQTDMSNAKDQDELARFTTIALREIVSLVNGNLSFSDNSKITLASAVFPGSAITVSIPHTLGQVPTGYIVTGLSADIRVFDGNKAADANNYYLQSTGSGTARVLIF